MNIRDQIAVFCLGIIAGIWISDFISVVEYEKYVRSIPEIVKEGE